MIKPYYSNNAGKIYQGDCLSVMAEMPDESVDAVVTDPPYSSGGFTRSDKSLSPLKKYQKDRTVKAYPDFPGDNKDERSWSFWSTLWISEAFRLLKPMGFFLMFSDWRMLPSASDAFQAGGVVWRGVAVWDKTSCARAPHKGYFRHQCEYILWGTKGPVRKRGNSESGPFPGCYSVRVDPNKKFHLTGKPLELMIELLQCTPGGGVILDPFAGSGTTCAAAQVTGRRYIGIECTRDYCEISKNRLQADTVE